MNLASIEKLLSTKIIGRTQGWKNELWDEIDSTNNRAIDLATEGAPEGLVMIARRQTAGRGRLGRTWVSPLDSGIYMSVLLRPRIPIDKVTIATLGCGGAVAETVLKCAGIKVGLKWVNDLVYDGKKLGGILAEMSKSKSNGLPPALIIGIGINMQFNEDDIPEDLRTRIEWLERVSGQSIDRNVFIACMLQEIENMYEALRAGDTKAIIDKWSQFSVTLGQEVSAEIGSKRYSGKAIGLAVDGALIIETSEGKQTLPAGEISLRSPSGAYY